MISFSLSLPNWFGGQSSFMNGSSKWWSFHDFGQLSKTRNWEIQLDYWGWFRLFEFELGLDTCGHDHAGPRLSITFLGYTVEISFPDNRHWNHEAGRWNTDAEDREIYS